jgi:hypothetical protein
MMRKLFPNISEIGGEEMNGDLPAEHTYDSPRSYCSLAIEELGLEPFSIEDTVKDTIDSYVRLGML